MRAALLLVALLAAGCASVDDAGPPPKPAPLVEQLPMLCIERGQMMAQLRDGFGEQSHGFGLTPGGAVFEFWRTPDGSTWTGVIHLRNGRTCLVVAGAHWQAVEPEPKGKDL